MAVKVRERKGMYRYLTVGLLTFLFSTSLAITACERKSGDTIQGVVEDASAAYERGDYATAYRLIKPLAEQGIAKTQYNLGVMYQKGEGVPQDYTEAMKWYQKAAEQGHAEAQYNLGVMYNKGEGVPQDHTKAAKWFRKAAEQGHADAQYFLGAMYGTGQGVPQDSVLAYMWLNLAAARFSASEGEKRGMVILNGEIIASKMTPEQIDEAQRLAREWKPKKEGK